MLKPGAITIDLQTGGIYGDIDHCPLPDLLESAEALWSLMPRVKHKGLWALAKAYDADCYLYTSNKRYKPPADIILEQDIYRGIAGLPASRRPFKLTTLPHGNRIDFFNHAWYEPLIGSIKDDKATSDIEGIPNLTAEARKKIEEQKRDLARKEAEKGKQEPMFREVPKGAVSRFPLAPKQPATTSPRPKAPARTGAEAKEGKMEKLL
jgi:hypothetical protein